MATDHTSDQVPLNLAAAYTELQRLLLQSTDVDQFLEKIAVLAAGFTTPPSSCGITLRRNGEVSTVAASSDLARQADEIQYGHGQGPCLHRMRTGEFVHMADMAADTRWDTYRINALAAGVRSSISVPLIVDDAPVGALNIYTDAPRDFTDADIRTAQAFAAQASAALALVMRYSEQLVLEEQLRNPLASRAVIDQALGIIMGQQHCDATEAFNVLRKSSQDRHIKLADIAAQMITAVTGKPPSHPGPSPGAKPRHERPSPETVDNDDRGHTKNWTLAPTSSSATTSPAHTRGLADMLAADGAYVQAKLLAIKNGLGSRPTVADHGFVNAKVTPTPSRTITPAATAVPAASVPVSGTRGIIFAS